MRNNGGIIGTGSSVRRKGAVPQSSGVWSTNNLRSFEQSGRPTNNLNELVFIGYHENISSDTTSATQTFSDVSLGPPMLQKRIIATVGYNQGGGEDEGIGISSATLTIPGAPSQLTAVKKEISTTNNAGQERSAVLYWDIPTSAGACDTGTISITYNSSFTTSSTLQGTIIGLYYIEDETEIVQTDIHTTNRVNSWGSHAVTYSSPVGYSLVIAAHGGSSTSNTITFTNGTATEDFEFKPDEAQDPIFAGASKTSDTIGEVTINPTPNSEYGVTTVVAMNKVIDLESTLTAHTVSEYLPPTDSTTTIPSTGSTVAYTTGGDFLVAIDIENFTNTDTGVMIDIGSTQNGITVGSVSGELRVNVGDGSNTWDGSNTGELSVASTTMDNYNGQNITLYVGVTQGASVEADVLRIGIQPNGGHGASTSGYTTLASKTEVLSSQLFTTEQVGFGSAVGIIVDNTADIGTVANYAGTITGIRYWAGEGSSASDLDADQILNTNQ